jgi:aldo/keto reductase family protein
MEEISEFVLTSILTLPFLKPRKDALRLVKAFPAGIEPISLVRVLLIRLRNRIQVRFHNGRGLLENATLKKMAKRNNATTSQIALAWILRQPGVIAIPKASKEKHVRDNARSIHVKLTNEDLSDLDREFPPPKSKKSLPML